MQWRTYVVQNNERRSPAAALITDSVEDSVSPESGHKLLNEQNEEDGADNGQEKVVDHEEGVELECRELLHDFTATKDDDIVCDKHHGGFLQGGQRGHTLGEVELAGGISHDLLKGLLKKRP